MGLLLNAGLLNRSNGIMNRIGAFINRTDGFMNQMTDLRLTNHGKKKKETNCFSMFHIHPMRKT